MSGVLRAIGAVASVVAVLIPPIAPIAAAVSVVASIGASLTAKKPSNDRQGSQLTFAIQPGGPLPYVMGRTAVGGSIVYRDTYGADNKYQSFVAVLSAGGPIDGFDDFLADKASVPFSGAAATGFFGGFMWQTRQLGATPEASALTNGIATPLPNWDSSYKLSGLAASAWTLMFDSKSNHYTGGEPAPLWVVRGVKVYDPRLDSTYPGGSGSCRWADPSDTVAHAAARATWVYSDSPALHALKWRLGVWERDEGDADAQYQKIMGIGAPIDLIDLAAVVAAANVQAANGWTIGGQIDSSMDKWDVLKLIEETGGCEPIAVGAMMSTLVKAPRTPRRTITAADLADGKLSAPAMRRRSDRINGYRASFRSEAHGWVITPIDIIQVPDYVTEDGRAKTGSGTFSLCQDANQAAELAAYEVFDSRELEPIVLPLKPLAAGDRLGDCLTVDLPDLGLEGIDAIVRGKQTDPQTGIVTLTLRSETAGKHAAALGLTGATPATPTLTAPPETVATPDADSWELDAALVAGTSVATPLLTIAGACENITADAVLFEYRKHGASDWIGTGVEPPDTTLKEIRGVDPETAYDGAVRYRVRGVWSDRLELGPVTTSARTVVGAGTFTLIDINKSIVTANGVTAPTATPWDGKARTVENYTRVIVSALATIDTGIGLDGNPTEDNGYSNTQYFFHRGGDGTLYLIRNGATIDLIADPHAGSPATPYPMTVFDNGETVRYFYDGDEIEAFAHAVDAPDELVHAVFNLASGTAAISEITLAVPGPPGDKGDEGDPGIDAINLAADPPSITVACTANGTPKGAIPDVEIIATQAGADIAGTMTVGTITSSGLSGVSLAGTTLSVTGMSADTGKVTIPVSHDGADASITIPYTKSKDGVAYVSDETTISTPGSSYGVVASIALLMGPGGTIDYDLNGAFAKLTAGTINTDGYVEYSLNGSTWTTATSFTGNAATTGVPGDYADSGSLDGTAIGLSTRQVVYLQVQQRMSTGAALGSFGGSFGVQWSG